MFRVSAIIKTYELSLAVKNSLADKYSLEFNSTVDDMVSSAKLFRPQIILCEQILFGSDQAPVLTQLKRDCPTAQVIIIGTDYPIADQIKALKSGVRGYFDTSLSIMTLSIVIAGVLRGEVWVERHVIAGLIDELVVTPKLTPQQIEMVDSLSPKELEVAKLVSEGASNKVIATEMFITERTVKAHLTATFQKLNINDRLSLAIFFHDLG